MSGVFTFKVMITRNKRLFYLSNINPLPKKGSKDALIFIYEKALP